MQDHREANRLPATDKGAQSVVCNREGRWLSHEQTQQNDISSTVQIPHHAGGMCPRMPCSPEGQVTLPAGQHRRASLTSALRV